MPVHTLFKGDNTGLIASVIQASLMFLTFLFSALLLFSSPHATEAFSIRSHKHHAVFAESNIRHENLTWIRPPALSHRAAGGPPAEHLMETRGIQVTQVLVTIVSFTPTHRQGCFGQYGCLLSSIS